MTEVLLVEDDQTIGRALQDALLQARYRVRWCRDGRSALAEAGSGCPVDLVVLDLGLPDVDGVDICRTLRSRWPNAVIVILTARDAEIDVVVGLEAGADDYLTKPVRTTEFLARLRAHFRRAVPREVAPLRLVFGNLVVDESLRRAWVGETEVALRSKEFDLLARLTRDAGVAISRSTLMADVWDTNWHGPTKTLDVHISSLRRALGQCAALACVEAPEVETLRGFGYRFVESRS